ncbi:TetR/AcrR family transcriptional regulator [Catenuloplanes atrovinosus]|uniref:AcrR family transcriptional regulator n=1 Tax=Catenuloplanes atrovinosus TaxID=137266 RepID=A0AAE4C9Y2_9ACTN|nr:TetR family transcriptional regulator C-terminal domain-containing protein [Catenuloplanes atrovinosus]MDR7275279.1 AcrR family transcriptional regulator [Catenuloplanes atrovinosus]
MGRVPKRVDHAERRELIVEALMRVAASGGLEAISLRHVAAEAGVTTGMVQHYFATKDDLMRFALHGIMERTTARVNAAMARLPQPLTPADTVRTLLTTLLPLDEERRADGRVGLAFLAYAAVEPSAAELLRDSTRQMAAFMADQIRAARAAGEASATVDAEAAGAGLLAAMEGLSIYVLGGYYTPETALRALDAHLTMIFTSRPA